MRVKIFRPTKQAQHYGVRLYAAVSSRSKPVLQHTVVFIRKTGMRRWLCDCLGQLFVETGRRRNCDHIKSVREKVGL
jgi:hypothetical protein